MQDIKLIEAFKGIHQNGFDNFPELKLSYHREGSDFISNAVYYLCSLGYIPTINFKQNDTIIEFIDGLSAVISQRCLFNREYYYDELTEEENLIRYKEAEKNLNSNIKYRGKDYYDFIYAYHTAYPNVHLNHIDFINEWGSEWLIALNIEFYSLREYGGVSETTGTIILLLSCNSTFSDGEEQYSLIALWLGRYEFQIYNGIKVIE